MKKAQLGRLINWMDELSVKPEMSMLLCIFQVLSYFYYYYYFAKLLHYSFTTVHFAQTGKFA